MTGMNYYVFIKLCCNIIKNILLRYFRLEELQLSNNELRSIDCVLLLPRLRTLIAAGNLMTTFGVRKICILTLSYIY